MASEWNTLPLKELCSKIGSGATPKGGSSVYLDSGEYALIRSQNVRNDAFHHNGLAYIEKAHADKLSNVVVETDDVLLNITGDSVARCCQVDPKVLPARVNQHVAIIRPKQSTLDARYLRYYLVSPTTQNELLSMAGIGATRNALTKGMIESFAISFPPLPEQKAIAHILGSLDDKIELNRRMNETLEGMAQALFKSWFVDFDPVIDNALEAGNPIPEEFSARAETRRKALADGTANREAAKAFPDSFIETDELGWIPEGWEPITFENLVTAKQGRYLAKNEMEEKPDGTHKYPVWGGNGILGYSQKKAYENPITLMTCRGSNCGLIKTTKSSAWVSNNSFACTAKFGSDYFLYLYFLSENFSECISGSAQPQITYTALKNKQMKSPLTREVCEEFSEVVQVYRDKQFSNEKQNERLTKLRDTLLPKLISGELRIEDAEKMVGGELI